MAETKNKGKNNLIIKILTVACIICAALLVAVLIFAFVGGGDKTTPGNVTPGEITTSEPVITTLPGIDNNLTTTQPSTVTTSVSTTSSANPNQKIAYATEDVNIRSGPSTDYDILGQLPAGGSVIFISKDENDWCKVMYDGEICYIFREYLTTVKPAQSATQPSADSSRKTVSITDENWYIVIVDKNRQIPEGFVPATEYIADSDCSLDARIAKYYDAMYNAALEDGVELTPYSGYRSYATQENNYNSLVQDYMSGGLTQEEAEAEAATEILPPGCSEHNLGLAIDIVSTDYDFIYSDEYAWLAEHAHEYGFIERYTEEKQDITGIIPEPWHWRFVGKHATAIRNSGLCLEEYYRYYGVEY